MDFDLFEILFLVEYKGNLNISLYSVIIQSKNENEFVLKPV